MDKNKGYISLHRDIRDHWIWKDKPFSKGQAWTDILMEVNHTDNKVVLGNEIIDIKRGQTIWSILDMSIRWGWSRKKTKNFLLMLQKDEMLYIKCTTKYTILTVANYDLYQNMEQQKKQRKNNKGTTREQQGNTNNNELIMNNNDIYSEFEKALEAFKEMRNKIKKPLTDYALEKLLNKLNKLGKTEEERIAILDQSTTKCWQDIYELKDQPKKNNADLKAKAEAEAEKALKAEEEMQKEFKGDPDAGRKILELSKGILKSMG